MSAETVFCKVVCASSSEVKRPDHSFYLEKNDAVAVKVGDMLDLPHVPLCLVMKKKLHFASTSGCESNPEIAEDLFVVRVTYEVQY